MKVKTVENKETLKFVFDFLSKLFYEEAIKYKEPYFPMGERYNEMIDQFGQDNSFLMYIERDDQIVAALTAKKMDITTGKIVLGILGVRSDYRGLGFAKKLINEFELRCKQKGIKKIELGARIRGAKTYQKLGYKPELMVQVFDFIKVDQVIAANKFNFEVLNTYQEDTYGFVFLKTPEVLEEYIEYFEHAVPTASAQYVFEKDLK